MVFHSLSLPRVTSFCAACEALAFVLLGAGCLSLEAWRSASRFCIASGCLYLWTCACKSVSSLKMRLSLSIFSPASHSSIYSHPLSFAHFFTVGAFFKIIYNFQKLRDFLYSPPYVPFNSVVPLCPLKTIKKAIFITKVPLCVLQTIS